MGTGWGTVIGLGLTVSGAAGEQQTRRDPALGGSLSEWTP
jgi:hypothetical protein